MKSRPNPLTDELPDEEKARLAVLFARMRSTPRPGVPRETDENEMRRTRERWAGGTGWPR